MDTNFNFSPQEDFSKVDLRDNRLNKRLRDSVEGMARNPQKSVLGALGGRSKAKGFYRLLENDKLDLAKLHEAEHKATVERMGKFPTVLCVQDTTDIDLNTHKKTKNLGYCSEHLLGVKLHSCLAITAEGLALGVIGQDYETRKEAKNPMSKEERKKLPIDGKENFRWLKMVRKARESVPDGTLLIHIADREGDFYELYSELNSVDDKFVIRVAHNRKTASSDKLIDMVRKTEAIGRFTAHVPRDSRKNEPAHKTEFEVAYCGATMMKPAVRKELHLPDELKLTVVRVTEIVESGEPTEWILATNLDVSTAEDCRRIVGYYMQRWKIERFHFVLKSGCNIEKTQQRTYEKLLPVFFIYSVIAAYIMAMTHLGRADPGASCEVFFSEIEWKALFCLGKKQETRL